MNLGWALLGWSYENVENLYERIRAMSTGLLYSITTKPPAHSPHPVWCAGFTKLRFERNEGYRSAYLEVSGKEWKQGVWSTY
jgi:hypothetical protein